MASKLLDKMIGIMGLGADEPEEELEEQEESEESGHEEMRLGRRGAQVLSIHTQKQTKVVVMEPTAFEEAQTIADQLRNRRPVIVNLENTDRNLAKRMVDFISGATYALGGTMQKVGGGIFLFVPSNVEISGEAREGLNERVFFWQHSK